jgi:hypothetical protein
MKIKGTSLDGETVEIDTGDTPDSSLLPYPDDGVIYLGGVPCAADTVEQVGFSDLLAMLKTVTEELEAEVKATYRNAGGDYRYNRDMQPVWNAQALIEAIEEATCE